MCKSAHLHARAESGPSTGDADIVKREFSFENETAFYPGDVVNRLA